MALKLEIQSVVRHRVPEVDDELAQKIGLSGVEEIRSMLRERLEGLVRERKEEITRDMVHARLLDKIELDMPESLVERADQRQRARMLVRLLRSGVPRDEAEQRVALAAQTSRQTATGSLKVQFILRQIAEQETILVTESEVDSQIRAFALRQGWRENRARDYLEEQGMVRALRDDMRESKTLDFLIENADVREIPVEEFREKYGAPQPGAEPQEAGTEPEPGEE